MDNERVDHELAAVYGELIDVGRQAKQAVWVAPHGPVRAALAELMTFLFTKAATVADAEGAINGRSPEMVSPSVHPPSSLVADAHRAEQVVPLLVDRLRDVVADVRRRAAEMDASALAALLIEIGDELDERVVALDIVSRSVDL